MLQTVLIVWRESLEAALIVGILLTYLRRGGIAAGARYVWGGAFAAILAAVAFAVISGDAIGMLDPDTQELLHAVILFLATGVLTWMVLWMHARGRGLKGELQRQADAVIATGRLLGLAAIAFVAVFREGVETVLFLLGVVTESTVGAAWALVAAGALGMVLAAGTAWIFFRGFRFLNLRTFFRITGILLLLVAGGLLMSGVNKLIMLGKLPPIVSQVWNASWLVRDDSIIGAILGALVGYRSRPSLLEVLALMVYLPPMLWLLRRADVAANGTQGSDRPLPRTT